MAGGTSFAKAPEGAVSPLFPFGPMMMHAKLPMSLVRRLNKYTNKTVKDEKKAKQLDHSDNLVGKLKQEFLIDHAELNKHTDLFNQIIANFVSTEIEWLPLNSVKVSDDQKEKLLEFFDILEES